ncbi:MAG: UBP-type zinc finger domain-containing protein [Acidimicrobiaceae bacterium]|nr:UBP-type zinc finger domain-containing protein [Acidimicrobiaceae bacterium]
MPDTCTHLDAIETQDASGDGCVECLQTGGRWVHLRRCASCGHIGCCDSSPGKHATAHFHGAGHPVIQSYEPGEDWFWCYVDELSFEQTGQAPSPSHP